MTQSIRIEDEKTIIESGRISVGNGTLPNRVVLRDLGDKFVVHHEVLNVFVEHTPVGDTVVFSHDNFYCGTYFEYGEYRAFSTRGRAHAAALTCFNERR